MGVETKKKFQWSRYNVLVVEDDEAIRQALRTLLEGAGSAGVRVAADGPEALITLEKFPADIALIEGNLEGMDSLDLLRAIRNKKSSPNPNVRLWSWHPWRKPNACAGCVGLASKPSSKNP